MENVSEICLKIDNILKEQSIPFETYKQLNHLLCDIVRVHNEKVGNLNDILENIGALER